MPTQYWLAICIEQQDNLKQQFYNLSNIFLFLLLIKSLKLISARYLKQRNKEERPRTEVDSFSLLVSKTGQQEGQINWVKTIIKSIQKIKWKHSKNSITELKLQMTPCIVTSSFRWNSETRTYMWDTNKYINLMLELLYKWYKWVRITS